MLTTQSVGAVEYIGVKFPQRVFVIFLPFDPAQKCYSKVIHRKEVTHSNGQ